MPVKELTGVATTAVKEAAAATASITGSFADALDNFLEKGMKTEVATGFKIQGRTCRATVILEILHVEEPKAPN